MPTIPFSPLPLQKTRFRLDFLNASAADFSEGATQMAKVTVVLTTNSGTGSRVGPVTITAYTVSGDQSTLSIPVDNP